VSPNSWVSSMVSAVVLSNARAYCAACASGMTGSLLLRLQGLADSRERCEHPTILPSWPYCGPQLGIPKIGLFDGTTVSDRGLIADGSSTSHSRWRSNIRGSFGRDLIAGSLRLSGERGFSPSTVSRGRGLIAVRSCSGERPRIAGYPQSCGRGLIAGMTCGRSKTGRDCTHGSCDRGLIVAMRSSAPAT
jgi:hypothetical protein